MEQSFGSSQELMPHFFGIPEMSKKGQYPVLVYRLPGQRTCYTFHHHRTNRNGEVYRCLGCQKNGQVYTKVLVLRQVEFATDPALLPHVCLPSMWVKEKTKRVLYERCQALRADQSGNKTSTREEYRKLIQDVHDCENLLEDEKKEILIFLHRYEKCRRTISRNIAYHRERVSMEHVPDAAALHGDGTRFLQVHTSDMHIYYTEKTIQLACRNDLVALVGDGMFPMHPNVREKNGQLYTIHGICSGKVKIPLLHAITNKKTQLTYMTIFGKLKDVLARMPGLHHLELRIILDFERGAINAARRLFPRASIEGCGFHLARAWNRKRDQLGLRKFMKGAERCRRIVQWWQTLKGIIFLPTDLYSRVPALKQAPVPRNHAGYQPCIAFLKYLNETWLHGQFAGMWNKFNVRTLRTTNVAETFHSNLLMDVRKKRPALDTLIKVLKEVDRQSIAKLLHHERFPNAPEELRRKDLLRRRKVNGAMRRFELRRSRGLLWTRVINGYCRRMSRFVSDKSNL